MLLQDHTGHEMLWEKRVHEKVLKNTIEVRPLADHACSDFEKRTKNQFDIQKWWFRNKVLNDESG